MHWEVGQLVGRNATNIRALVPGVASEGSAAEQDGVVMDVMVIMGATLIIYVLLTMPPMHTMVHCI